MDEPHPDAHRPKAPKSKAPWVALGLLLLAAGGALFWRFAGQDPAGAPAPIPVAVDVPDAGPFPVAAVPDAGVAAPLPRTGWADIRRRAPSRTLRRYLGLPGILRRAAAAVYQVSQGKSPRAVLDFLEPDGRFRVRERTARDPAKDRIYIHPKSYARYDFVRKLATRRNARFLGRSYRELSDVFEGAFREVGDGRFETHLRRALRKIVGVRVPRGRIQLTPKGAVYAFADPKLEALDAAEKHVVRLGRKNARQVQRAARWFAQAAELKL